MKFSGVFQQRKISMKAEFLSKIRPLMVFCTIFGICSVSGDNKYKICSVSWLWSFAHVVSQSIVIFIYKESSWKEFMMPYMLFRSILVNSLIIIEGRKLTKVIDKFSLFDSMYGEIYNKQIKKGWLQCSWTWVILSTIEMIIIYNVSLYFTGFTVISSFFDTLTYIQRLNSMHLYIFFCWNIVSRIQNLSKQWNQQINLILKSKIIFLRTIPNGKSLERTRIFFFQLCEIVDEINNAFGTIIICVTLTICIEILFDLYTFCFVNGGQRIAQFLYPGINMFTMYMLCLISGRIHTQVRNIIFIFCVLNLNLKPQNYNFRTKREYTNHIKF